MKDKRKEPAADKLTGSKRMTEAKHLLKSKQKELDSQEARLLLRFLETYPPADATLAACEMVWAFIQWLKEKRYHVIQEETVFCVPFSHLVEKKKLK